ncbi:MAG: hypothetical protein GWN80_02260 [Gammaproteobacteria bacterium]|nr:hypothetical protein [Gammaproteobacteria bacterium]NIW46268.1 hypothetical protein [Gammaproteobacteria bacterium]
MTRLNLWLLLFTIFVFFFCSGFTTLSVHPQSIEPEQETLLRGDPFIYRIPPEARGGEAYKMIYIVPVPIELTFSGDLRLISMVIS